jgi:hypothetical protein
MSPKRTDPSTSVMTAGSFGLAGLEELGDARQAAGDVARLVRLARDLRQRGTRLDRSSSRTVSCAPTGMMNSRSLTSRLVADLDHRVELLARSSMITS